MSLDLFSSIDFYFSNFSFFSNFAFYFSFFLFFALLLNSKLFSRNTIFLNNILLGVKSKVSSYLLKKLFGFKLFIFILFLLVFLSKILGLFPFAFGWTSHILIILPFAFFIWLLIQFSSLKKDLMGYFSHYTPQGVPLGLGLFLAKIELVSKIMRPLTLSLRLGMKITTGHILLALISIMGVSSSFSLIFMIMLSLYFFFELFVMLIQAVVFSLLISQYFEVF